MDVGVYEGGVGLGKYIYLYFMPKIFVFLSLTILQRRGCENFFQININVCAEGVGNDQ